ncbi:hypothetical protein [Thalassotalea aquiviva]|uniref:hypothetical protein n=1 Tax=Thalassotalea aquiviva TaxID=3242415 RepID=UPI00352A663C
MYTFKFMRFILGTIVLLFLCSCGGSSDDKPTPVENDVCTQTSIYYCPTSVFQDPFGIALTFAWYSGQCSQQVLCRENENFPVITPEDGVIDEAFIADNWTSTSVIESEPNNAFDQAQAFIVRSENGVLINGRVNYATDPKDTFAFILDGEPTITIYLCATPTDCTQPWYQGADIFIELYDDSKVLLDSTRNMPAFGHAFTSGFFFAGHQYFLVIHSTNSRAGDIAYKLVITD